MEYYYEKDNFKLIKGDCFQILKEIPEQSIDMIFADPPYFLSNGGISCHSGRQVSVNKGSWDVGLSSEDKLGYNRAWISLCRKILKDNGSIWISGTYHNIYSIGVALELEGFSIINNITWQKPNPSPNLACRCFTHSNETIIWARKIFKDNKKAKHTFNYSLMKKQNDNKQMKDVWLLKLPSKLEKQFGKHPTQKPVELLKRIVLASTNENDVVLDPFNGSGTTGISSVLCNRKYIGIEQEDEYLELSTKRYENIEKEDDINGN